MKRLALFLDGTWNDPEDKTSVYRMAQSVVTSGDTDSAQRVYYGQGVGTHWYDKLRGGVLGEGLYGNLQQAYAWLAKHYEDGDKVFIFGFSRGAYTARSLAGMIAKCGLVEHGVESELPMKAIYSRYQRGKGAEPIYTLHKIEKDKSRALSPEEETLLRCSRRIPVEMIGVWDTVGSLGIPWTSAPILGRENFYFHNTNPSRLYRHAYQALALDEHRGPYEPTLWTDFSPEKPDPIPERPWTREQLEQRWFIGAHSDVGGGYKGGALDRIPMSWLQAKATALGLHLSERVAVRGDEIDQAPTDSFAQFLKGAYRALRLGVRYYRPVGRKPQPVKGGTSVHINEVIDGSVFERWRKHAEYRPANLVEWAKERAVDPGTLVGEQLA